MAHEYDFEEVKREFGVVFEPSNKVSQFGGMAPFIAFLKKGNFRERLRAEFGWEKARTILQFTLGIVAGAEHMKDIAEAGGDPLVKKYIGTPIGAAQLGRDFRSFSKSEIERFHDFVMSLSLLYLAEEIDQEEPLIFDVDATSVRKFGEQEGVEQGYIDRGKIKDCYQYLLFRLHNLNCFLHGTIRAGGAHSQNGFGEYLKRFLPLFIKRWQTIWRADSGYFSEEAIDIFSQNDATFFIKAPMSEARVSTAAMSTDLQWVVDDENPNIEYASLRTVTEQKTAWREVYKRAREEKGQLLLGETGVYRYDCIATNDFAKEEKECFKFYNGRAHIENNIRELKYDYHLGDIVTENFDANDIITQATLLTYLLITHFKSKVLPPEMRKNQLSTIRSRVFNIPGRFMSAARKLYMKMHNVFVDAASYASMFYRIKYLKSWVLSPPDIAI